MNAEPHMHRIEMSDYAGGNSQRLKYGDSRVIVHAFFFTKMPSAWRINRGIKRVIKKHDKGSLKHASYQASIEKVNQHIVREREVIGHHSDGTPITSSMFGKEVSPPAWGRDVLMGRYNPELVALDTKALGRVSD